MKVSIIIPVKEINDYIFESIPKILEMDFKDFEIIILPNEDNIPFEAEKTRILPSGKIGPAQKRNLGAKNAQGEILAFLDDDAYPRKDWLTNALKNFENNDIVAVGGAGITPRTDPFRAKVSGNVFLTKMGGGNPDRYIPGKKSYFVDDRPSVNLLVRKKEYLEIGGFDMDYWPGEDTKLGLDLRQKTGKKILYDPTVVVWHHRRPSISKHILQTSNYGLHRGFFAKEESGEPLYKEMINFVLSTSGFFMGLFGIRKGFFAKNKDPMYFIPSIFFLFFMVFGLLSFFNHYISLIFVSVMCIYVLGLIIGLVDIYTKNKEVLSSLCSIPLIFITHIVYGYSFIRGYLKKDLKSKLR